MKMAFIRVIHLKAFLAVAWCTVCGCVASTAAAPTRANESQTQAGAGVVLADDLSVTPIADGVWLHTSKADVPGFGPIPANGLVILGEGGSILVDTPWKEAQTERLLDWAASEWGAPVKYFIATHAHDDRIGGIAAVHRRGAVSYATAATAAFARADGRESPQRTLAPADRLELLGFSLEIFFPGAGHTGDNIVVYLPTKRLLFGGCFIKAADARDLGNTASADIPSWSGSLDAVAARYPNAAIVVPGHGDPGGPALITHTTELVRTALATGPQ